jgi:uncharacterized protein with FMN-binding domain
MKRNRVAVVTTVSTVMLGAGWAAGVVAAGFASSDTTTASAALGSATTVGSTTAEPVTPSSEGTDTVSRAPDASSSTTSPADPAPGVTGTFDGALVSTNEGDFQAEIVVDGGVITAVNVLVDGDNRHDSVKINQSALPTLQERVLTAQTWDVQGISGASYTVQGFLTSVKDAMTQAGLA